jgi:hypothetical protein
MSPSGWPSGSRNPRLERGRAVTMIFVGDDWAEAHHDVYVCDEAGTRLAARRMPEGIGGLAILHELIATHASDPSEVVVGIETDRGQRVQALVEANYAVYAINPKSAPRYRDRHTLSGAKSASGRRAQTGGVRGQQLGDRSVLSGLPLARRSRRRRRIHAPVDHTSRGTTRSSAVRRRSNRSRRLGACRWCLEKAAYAKPSDCSAPQTSPSRNGDKAKPAPALQGHESGHVELAGEEALTDCGAAVREVESRSGTAQVDVRAR